MEDRVRERQLSFGVFTTHYLYPTASIQLRSGKSTSIFSLDNLLTVSGPDPDSVRFLSLWAPVARFSPTGVGRTAGVRTSHRRSKSTASAFSVLVSVSDTVSVSSFLGLLSLLLLPLLLLLLLLLLFLWLCTIIDMNNVTSSIAKWDRDKREVLILSWFHIKDRLTWRWWIGCVVDRGVTQRKVSERCSRRW